MKLDFVIEKETKGAVQYKECKADGSMRSVSEGAAIGTLYLRKSALEGRIPKTIQVELTLP